MLKLIKYNVFLPFISRTGHFYLPSFILLCGLSEDSLLNIGKKRITHVILITQVARNSRALHAPLKAGNNANDGYRATLSA